MTLAQFARLCETIEYMRPTEKVRRILGSMVAFDSPESVFAIFSLELGAQNNIGEKRAIKWIAKSMGMFDSEVETAVDMWGDIGEGVVELDVGNEKDSDITLNQFYHLLTMDCSTIEGNAYKIFSTNFNKMSAREKKWFTRYWMRKPRNGVNAKTMLKVLALRHPGKEVKKYSQYNSISDMEQKLSSNVVLKTELVIGNFIKPMLAKPYAIRHHPQQMILDVKYDGNRYQIHKKGFDVIVFNRSGKVVTTNFPDVVSWVQKLNNNFIVDTEIYPINADGSPAEHKLMAKRVHKKNVDEAVEQCPVRLAIFDLLNFNGDQYIESPLYERIELLDEHFPEEHLAQRFDKDCNIQSAYNIAINRGFEGIMIKDATLPYQSGKRSTGWLKHKPPRIELDVVITSGQYGKGKRTGVFGSFGISVKDGANYVKVGNCGTGFSWDDLVSLTRDLRKNLEGYEGDEYYFLPRTVIQVTCDLVSTDANGNIGLRFPRCMRLRPDKYPADIDTLQRVKELM